MAEPVDRGTFMGAQIRTQAQIVDGKPLFFVDVLAPSDEQSVTIGWSPDRGHFGVYVNGMCVHPVVSLDPDPDPDPDLIHPDDLITIDEGTSPS